MAYIGFFDMLGIQSVAEYDYDEYRKSLEIFQEKIQFICEVEVRKHPNNKIQIYNFSDCAYIESTSLIQLIDFYSMLRSELFIDGIFFNAALCEGSLNAHTNKKQFAVFVVTLICVCLFTATTVYAAGDVSTAITSTWNAAKAQIKTVVNNVVFPVVDTILAILFFVKIGTAYFDYRKHGQFEFTAPDILFACLIFTLTAPLYIWGIVGM